jgi:formylglycine-generating enzyme required for sulfatase activity
MRQTVVLSAMLLLAIACAPDTKTPIDRSSMVLIPAGNFVMGKEGGGEDCPPHQVEISAFYLDKYEVTNGEYLKFCEATDHRLPEFWGTGNYGSGPEFPDHPVVGVSWNDARLFAQWAGKRLPTEAEWEYAARGGLQEENFPTGGTLEPSMANYSDSKQKGPVPVGNFPPNGYGLHDMAGNVVEWVADRYAPDAYGTGSAPNPTGPSSGRFRVIRGGGWHSGATCNRVYYRNALPPNWVDFNVGFRCAKDAARPDWPRAAASPEQQAF